LKSFFLSGRLVNRNESVFNYSLSPGTFAYYTNQTHNTVFLEDLTGNLTTLFNYAGATHNESAIQSFSDLCENDTHCLLAIARADNIEAGQFVMNQIHEEELKKEYAGKVASVSI